MTYQILLFYWWLIDFWHQNEFLEQYGGLGGPFSKLPPKRSNFVKIFFIKKLLWQVTYQILLFHWWWIDFWHQNGFIVIFDLIFCTKKKRENKVQSTIKWFLRLLLLRRDIGNKIPMSMKHLSKQIIQITLITKVELLTNNWSLFLQIGERTKPSNRLLKIRAFGRQGSSVSENSSSS